VVRPEAHPLTRSAADLRSDLLTIVRAGIASASARLLVERALDRGAVRAEAPVWLVAAGKAAPAMAGAAAARLGSGLLGGLVVAPHTANLPAGLDQITGGHPVPSPGSETAGRRALEFVGQLGPEAALVVLLSGGASALLAVPAAGLTLDDKVRTTRRLLAGGADIASLNAVRKHLSAIKGGWLAAATGAACRTLAVSDVVGDDLSVIGSGPTVPDPTTFGVAREVLERFGGLEAYPPAVVARLDLGAAGRVPETPKPGDRRLARATAVVVGGRRDAEAGAAREAGRRGYRVVHLDHPVVGEARAAGAALIDRALTLPASAPVCVLSSGETTVQVTGAGKGGRNQELVLAASAPLGRAGGRPIAIASVGTDGVDGPTDAAGALADTTTIGRAVAAGLDAPAAYLARNDAYAFFDALGDLIRTGATDTNVGDLQVILLA